VTTVLVTGANQGLGIAVVEGVVRRLGPRTDVYLTGRNPDRVRAAADRLAQVDLAVHTAVLDVRDTDAVETLAAQLAERHNGIDVVISNAAARITPERPAAEQVAGFVDTNSLGTTRMIRGFGPLLPPAAGSWWWRATSARSAACRRTCTSASTPSASPSANSTL
jgi:carbonyl reductase 1